MKLKRVESKSFGFYQKYTKALVLSAGLGLSLTLSGCVNSSDCKTTNSCKVQTKQESNKSSKTDNKERKIEITEPEVLGGVPPVQPVSK